MFLSFLVAKVVSKPVVDKPLAELGPIVEFVFDHPQSIREKKGYARQALRDSVVKTTWLCVVNDPKDAIKMTEGL